MTNKEAMEILKAYKQRLENSCSNQLDKDIKAFDLAIEALNRDGTIPYENDEPIVHVCPVCGSVWNIKEAENVKPCSSCVHFNNGNRKPYPCGNCFINSHNMWEAENETQI